MSLPALKIDKLVDHYFASKSAEAHPPHPYSQHCPVCIHLNQNTNDPYDSNISRDDIDLLEIMDPNMTPEQYMDNIMHLYQKEQNLRSRQQKNTPMQLALSTRRILTQTTPARRPKDHESSQQQMISHTVQIKTDKKDEQQIRKLRDECYLGLGKLIVSRTQKKNEVELTNSNYHTREFLLPLAKAEVDKLQQKAQSDPTGPKKFYILVNANSRGINLQTDAMPVRLGRVLQFNKYREIVCTINEIIQKTVFNHKKEETALKKTNPLYLWLTIALILIVSLLMFNSLHIHSMGMEIGCLISSFCLILLILMASCHEYHKELVFIPLVEKINTNITDYLSYLNSRPGATLIWKTPPHLYWIQITLIRERKDLQFPKNATHTQFTIK